jgi:hypothetical protein
MVRTDPGSLSPASVPRTRGEGNPGLPPTKLGASRVPPASSPRRCIMPHPIAGPVWVPFGLDNGVHSGVLLPL